MPAPGTIFNLDDDMRAFMLRVVASLERADGLMEETQRTIRNVNEGVTELRELVSAMQSGAEAFSESLTKGKP